jgi:hypothetical protein
MIVFLRINAISEETPIVIYFQIGFMVSADVVEDIKQFLLELQTRQFGIACEQLRQTDY